MLWIDGGIRTGSRAEFDLRDRGLLLGDGLFETIPAVNGRPVLLEAHLDRLLRGAAALGIRIGRERLREPVEALAAAAQGRVVIRLTVTRGVGPRGLKPPPEHEPGIFAAVSGPWAPAPGLPEARLATSRIRRNPHSPTARHKTLAYLDNVLALQEALDAGADDALLLNTEGRPACTSAANLFVIQGDSLQTPPAEDGVLAGITRALILERIAPDIGLATREVSLEPGQLRDVDAVFLTNSVALATLATSLDGAPLGARGRELVAAIRARLLALVHDASSQG